MKFRNYILFILFIINLECFAQNSNTIISFRHNELCGLDYDDLFKGKNKTFQIFTYNFDKKSKFIEDSLLVSKIEIDRDSNKVFGKSFISTYESLGKTYLSYFNFQYYYNLDGQVIQYIFEPDTLDTSKVYREYSPITIKEVTINDYYTQNKLSKKTINNYQKYYKTNKKDTLWVNTYDAKIEEFEYNENGFEVNKYITIDSTIRDLATGSFNEERKHVTCKNCQEKYLAKKSIYNENGKIKEQIVYSHSDKISIKTCFYYDKNNNLISEVDSVVDNYLSMNLKLRSTTSYEYSDSEKIETITYNQNLTKYHSPKKIIITRNSLNQLKSEYKKYVNAKPSFKYFYYYENHKLKSIVSIDNKKRKLTTTFLYNKQGQLIERKETRKKKIIDLKRYYYD